MNKYTRTILAIAAFILFMGAAYIAYEKLTASAPADLNKSKESVAAVDFTVYASDGSPVQLSDFYDKPVIINFWASWCTYCREEMPLFQETYEKYGDQINFLMINSTDGAKETIETARDYIDSGEYTFPVYFDTDGQATVSYEASSLPTTVIIDKHQTLAAYQPGRMTEEMMDAALDLLNLAP